MSESDSPAKSVNSGNPQPEEAQGGGDIPSQETAFVWTSPDTEKYAHVPIADEDDAVPGSSAHQTHDPLYAHFDLLPDTSVGPAALNSGSLDVSPADDVELLTGRPAWFYSHLVTSGSEGQDTGASAAGEVDTHSLPEQRGSSRWFALKRIFNPEDERDDIAPARVPEQHVPCLAVFSLAGGTGKTSLVATLGRALSAHGERVLMVDTTSLGLLPFYFGSRDLRPGVMRTFTAAGSTDAVVSMVSIDPHSQPDSIPQEHGNEIDSLSDEISRHARGASRILIDVPTSAGDVSRRLRPLAPTLLVPIAPDMNSVVSLNAIQSLFRDGKMSGETISGGRPIQPYYLINKFDPSLPLHLDVREVLREQLGDRLLPFVLRRNPVVSDAMAQGMTVMDYAPTSTVAEDYMTLAAWIRNVSAPAVPGYRGVRWTERPQTS